MPTTPNPHAVVIVSQMIEVNDVVQVVETDAILDAESGDWIRDIQIFRANDVGETNSTLVLTVRIKGEQKSNIYFHAPEQQF